MIVYNVTINVEEGIADVWLQWLQGVHIPEVMATGCFLGHRVLRMLTANDGEEGITYAIQYDLNSMEDYVRYQDNFALALRSKGEELFGDRFFAFRTLLEKVEPTTDEDDGQLSTVTTT